MMDAWHARHGGRSNRKQAKEIAHKQAQDRQAKYDALTPEQKLEALTKRPGESLRERARLEPLVEPKKPRPRRRAKRPAKKVTAQAIRESQRRNES